MTDQDFDRLVNSIRDDVPNDETARAAADRVRDRLRTGGMDEVCAHFRADFDAYRAGRLSEGRKMLLDDHLHSCVACRREYSGVRNTVVPISRPKPLIRRAQWAAAAAVVIGSVALSAYALAPRIDRAMAPSGPRATVASVAGTLVLVSESTTLPLAVGAAIAEGQEIRTGKGSRAVILLRDGSRIDLTSCVRSKRT